MTQINESPEKLKVGCLVIADRLASALPLELTSVSIQVNGPLASVVVTQRFGNPLDQAADLEYLYPLPETAAITDFVLKIGERTVRAELKEVGEANERFEEARLSGRRAGLFEQRRENLFSVRLANVQPGETILTTVRYQQRLAFKDDGYELVFPMGLTPKYDSADDPQAGTGVHAPVAQENEPIGPVEINVAVDAGLSCAQPYSPSHQIEVTRLDERRFHLQLAGCEIPDHDFVVRYSPIGDQPHTAAWLSGAGDGHYFLASLLPPIIGDETKPSPREFIFVLDRSGSMGGEPIAQARNALRACLRSLMPADTFRILLFDDRLEWYRQETCPVNQNEIDMADRFLEQVNARGGTEIVAALDAALGLPHDVQRTRYVVFLTDGAVSAELRTLELLRRKAGSARIFTFGIGPSVNRALLNRMAVLGRGMAEFLQADEDIEGAIIRFQDRVSFPVLTDVQLNLEGGSAWDIYPARLPDLYVGQPLEISGRVKPDNTGPITLNLTGRRGNELVTVQAVVSGIGTDEPAVARLWARARIDDLLEEAALAPERTESVRAAVLELALAHRMVTQYTAFVGIDQAERVEDGKAVSIQVSLPLPRGLDWDLVTPGVPTGQVLYSKMIMQAAPLPISATPRPRNLRRSLAEDTNVNAMMPAAFEPDAAHPKKEDRKALLRWLARSQRLDGSWDGSVERTSAALLAFVRAGHTTQTGDFRVVLRRAVAWLGQNEGQGLARFLRVRVFEELARSTGVQIQQANAQAAREGLLEPTNIFELAAVGLPVPPHKLTDPVDNLEDLRLVVLRDLKPEVDRSKFTTDLECTWLACI